MLTAGASLRTRGGSSTDGDCISLFSALPISRSLNTPTGLVKVKLNGSATSVFAVVPTLLLGIENGSETMNTAVPTIVAAKLTGLTRRMSTVASKADRRPGQVQMS